MLIFLARGSVEKHTKRSGPISGCLDGGGAPKGGPVPGGPVVMGTSVSPRALSLSGFHSPFCSPSQSPRQLDTKTQVSLPLLLQGQTLHFSPGREGWTKQKVCFFYEHWAEVERKLWMFFSLFVFLPSQFFPSSKLICSFCLELHNGAIHPH